MVTKTLQVVIYNKRQNILIACEQALLGALASGRENEGELATTSLKFEFHFQVPCGFPLTGLSESTNQGERKQTLKTRVISAFSILYRLLECTYPERPGEQSLFQRPRSFCTATMEALETRLAGELTRWLIF